MATPRTGRPRGRPKRELPPDDGSRPDLPPQAWACIEVELSCGGIGSATLGTIKRHLKSDPYNLKLARESIRRWRRLKPIYQRGAQWLLDQVAEGLDRKYAACERAEQTRQELEKEVVARVRERLPQWVEARWYGAIRSMANGVIYTSPASYTAHLLEANNLPVELYDEARAELAAEARGIRLSA